MHQDPGLAHVPVQHQADQELGILAATTLRIAGRLVRIGWPSDAWIPPVLPRLGKYLADGTADLALEVRVDPDVAASPGGEPRVVDDGGALHLLHDQYHGVVGADGAATLTIYQAGDAPDDPTYAMVVDSLLRMQLATAMAPAGGILMHAAGIAVSDDAGYVFFGPSGSGKTTVCGLSSPRFTVLCDEVVALYPVDGGGYRLAGTPFAGAWGDSTARDVPLVEVLHLRQAPATERVTLAPAAAMRAVLESAVAYHQSPAMREAILAATHALIMRVPVNQLAFVPKESLWETVLAPRPTR